MKLAENEPHDQEYQGNRSELTNPCFPLFKRMSPELNEDNDDAADEVPEVEEEQAASTTSPPPPPSPPRGRVRRGCISKQNRLCTQNTKHCRYDLNGRTH